MSLPRFSPRHLFLAPLALLMAPPLIWMTITSIQTPDESRHFPPVLIPSGIDWHNYTNAIDSAPFGAWYLNSVIVCAVVVASNLAFCASPPTPSRASASSARTCSSSRCWRR